MAINTTLPIKTVTYNGTEIPIYHPSAPTPSYDTPTINVSASGLITASANGKSATEQLSTQSGKTVTPSESEQTAVSSGKYTTGDVKVGAISTTYVGSGVTRQSAKTVTPTKSSQTAVASGVYTTGAITVGAIPSEYIVPSGSQTLNENKTYDVTSLASVTVNVPSSGGEITVKTATKSQTSNTTSISFTGLTGEPKMFSVILTTQLTSSTSRTVTSVTYDGSTLNGTYLYESAKNQNAISYVSASYFSKVYSNGTLTVSTSSSSNGGYFRGGTYKLVYAY